MTFPEDFPFKSGFVALVGRPNVGKSTFLNALMGQKIAAVSPRPQTTRQRQFGILTNDEVQIIFMDTPGMHKPKYKLGEYMNQVVIDTLSEADIILWMVDATDKPHDDDLLIANHIKALKDPNIFIGLNKTDGMPEEKITAQEMNFLELAPSAKIFRLSAKMGTGLDPIYQALVENLPSGMPFYDPEQITDLYEREIAAELIREAALIELHAEVPHAIAIRIDEFKERSEKMAYIAATIFIEKDSQKGIVIGKGGSMLKQIGAAARREIEAMSGRKIYLELRVKVNKNWRNNMTALSHLGYKIEKQD
jgi:GTP-binding protein Era